MLALLAAGCNQQWMWVYGDQGAETNPFAISMSLSGYMVAGSTKSEDSEIDGFLSRLYYDGTELWRYRYGWEGSDDGMLGMVPISSWALGGDFLVVGGSNNSQGAGCVDGWITRIESDGDVAWTKLQGGPQKEQLLNVSRTGDGDFLAVGFSEESGQDKDCWLVKLDEDGNVFWEYLYDTGEDENCRLALEVEDDGQPGGRAILVVGHRGDPATGKDSLVMKLGSDGTPIWQRIVGGENSDRTSTAAQIFDQEGQPAGYVIGGTTNNAPDSGTDNALVFHLSEGGEYSGAFTLWGGDGFEEGEIHSMVRRSDGTLVLGGFTRTPNHGDGWILALDWYSGVLWSHAYGGWEGQEILSGEMSLGTYGEYGKGVFATGPSKSWDEKNDIWTLAADEDGRIPGCSKMMRRPCDPKILDAVEMSEVDVEYHDPDMDEHYSHVYKSHSEGRPQKLCPMDCLVHVDAQSQASSPDGDSWETAYSDLNEGILAAAADLETSTQDHCEVWTAEGIYTSYETAQTDTFQLAEDVHVYGGFPTDDPETPQSEYAEDFLGRDWETYQTILNGGEDLYQRSYHVVTGADGALLDGAYVENGLAVGEIDVENVGGGIFLDGVTTSVRNCEVRENFAFLYGGGVFSRGGESVFEHVELLDNGYDDEVGSWTWFGGGVFSMDASVSLWQCELVGNRAEYFGGGVYSHMTDPAVSAPEVLDSTLTGNEALAGAAILTHNAGTSSDPWAAPLHVNLLIHDNHSTGYSNPDMGIDRIDGAIATYGDGAHPV
ncbi:MAG: hypothetical protein R6V85_09285, partial [Polyangia bacterium]